MLSWSCDGDSVIHLGDSGQHIEYSSSALMQRIHAVVSHSHVARTGYGLFTILFAGNAEMRFAVRSAIAGVCMWSLPGQSAVISPPPGVGLQPRRFLYTAWLLAPCPKPGPIPEFFLLGLGPAAAAQ